MVAIHIHPVFETEPDHGKVSVPARVEERLFQSESLNPPHFFHQFLLLTPFHHQGLLHQVRRGIGLHPETHS